MGLLVALCLSCGCLLAWGFTWGMRWLAPRVGLIDQPNARKIHCTPTPLGGGLAIWLAVTLPLLTLLGLAAWLVRTPSPPALIPGWCVIHAQGVVSRTGGLLALLTAGAIIAALGLLDDLKPLSWWPKLTVQFLVAGGLVASGVRATLFQSAPWVGDLITLVWLVGLTNAFNFLDNMDALSGGIGMITATVFAVIMLSAAGPHWFVAGFLLLLAGALAGFLVHNWPPARIFMGDTGSCLIGLWIASLTVLGTFYETSAPGPHVIFAPICVLAVPLYDLCSVVVIRLRQGRSPFRADKSHFSHRLVELGLTRRSAVLTIHLVTLMTGLAGLLLFQVPGLAGCLLVLAVVGCALAVIAILETAGRRSAKPPSGQPIEK